MIFGKDTPQPLNDATPHAYDVQVGFWRGGPPRAYSTGVAPQSLRGRTMKTLRRLTLVFALTVGAVACNTNITAPDWDTSQHTPDPNNHTPDPNNHTPDPNN